MDISTVKAVPKVEARARSQWWFVVGTILFVLGFTSLPYLYAFLSAPSGKQFMGIMLDVPDHAQYFSWFHDLARSFLISDKLTPEPSKAVFFNLLWFILGRVGLLLGLDFRGMYQVLRLVATPLLLLLFYRMISFFIRDRLMRRTAFLIAVFASGLGWVLVLLKYTAMHGQLIFPLDVYVAEGNTFLDILGYAHFVAAALYIFAFDLVLRGQESGQLRYAVWAGIFAFILGWMHAYDLALVYGILGGYALLKLIRDRRLPMYLVKSLVIIGAISWWPGLYSEYITRADPIWHQVLAQFANAGVYSPSPLHVPILLGFAFLLALYTFIRSNPLNLRTKDDKQLFVLAWFIMNFLLIYIPTDFQIHMLNGWQVPIAILATQGLFYYIAPWVLAQARRLGNWGRSLNLTQVRRWAAVAFIVLILPTNLYLWVWRFTDLSQHDYPYYLYTDEVQAMDWLSAQNAPNDVVLSSLTIGQYIPAMTGMHSFLGHWAQTLDFYGKEAMVNEFYNQATSDARREQILQTYHVNYVFDGPAEQAVGSYNPGTSPWLKLVFSSPNARLYQVMLPAASN